MLLQYASERNTISGAFFASFAIGSSFVELLSEVCGSVIVPSSGSVIRCRPLLRGFPSVGSPLRHYYCGTPTPCRPLRVTSFPSFRATAEIHQLETTGPLRFLGPPLHACPALIDPGGTRAPGLRDDVPTSWCVDVTFRPSRLLKRAPEESTPVIGCDRLVAHAERTQGSRRCCA